VKRENIEILIGFLDSIRQRDRKGAEAFLHPAITRQGLDPDATCRTLGEVLDIFLGKGAREMEIEALEVTGTELGVVFAFHRSEPPDVDEELIGRIYHSCGLEGGRITSIQDHRERPEISVLFA
jgi:hypothetical protein